MEPAHCHISTVTRFSKSGFKDKKKKKNMLPQLLKKSDFWLLETLE